MDKRLRQIEKAVADIRELEVNGPSNQLVHLPAICGYFEFLFTELSYCRSIIDKRDKVIEAAREMFVREYDDTDERMLTVDDDDYEALMAALAELDKEVE